MLRRRGRMFGVKALDAIEPGGDQIGDGLIVAIQTGMRQHGQTTGLMDQFDRIQRGHLGLEHYAGRPFFRKRSKASSSVRHWPMRTSVRAERWTARRLAVRQREDILSLQRHAQRVDLRDHFADAVRRTIWNLAISRSKPFVLGINKVSENVQLGVRCVPSKFRADDKFDSPFADSLAISSQPSTVSWSVKAIAPSSVLLRPRYDLFRREKVPSE